MEVRGPESIYSKIPSSKIDY
ncbi:hypothetical protein Gogos_000602 [Gossypium gossypioides]|uniref:Uncharacterized protein n=1 Tax=Gossypium gossypioides TaxID=34282 RepID=A0A7J9CTC2_GOSGO|nr:hypothetical protein [Gossypium gossypioides]